MLRYVEDEPGAARVEQIINLSRMGKCRLIISAVNWGEVSYILTRKFGKDEASGILRSLRALPVSVAPVFATEAEQAGEFKRQYNVPYADAFAGALAVTVEGTLVTTDYDFKTCVSAVAVEFLSAGAGRSKA